MCAAHLLYVNLTYQNWQLETINDQLKLQQVLKDYSIKTAFDGIVKPFGSIKYDFWSLFYVNVACFVMSNIHIFKINSFMLCFTKNLWTQNVHIWILSKAYLLHLGQDYILK